MNPTSTPPTLNLRDAAQMMKVHPKTVEDMIRGGVLPAGKVGRSYVLMTKDVLAHIEQQIINQTAERLAASGRRERPTRAGQPSLNRAGSRSASSSGAIYVR